MFSGLPFSLFSDLACIEDRFSSLLPTVPILSPYVDASMVSQYVYDPEAK